MERQIPDSTEAVLQVLEKRALAGDVGAAGLVLEYKNERRKARERRIEHLERECNRIRARLCRLR